MPFCLLTMLSLPGSLAQWIRSRRNNKVNVFDKTERLIVELLPDDISQTNFEAIDRATSLGLFPMEGGWMAGGYIAKLAVKRLRSEWSEQGKKISRGWSPQRALELAEELNAVDPSVQVDILLRIRINLVRRGLLE